MDSRIRIVGLLSVLVIFTAGIAGCDGDSSKCGPDPQGCTWNGTWVSPDATGTITNWVFYSDGTHSGEWVQNGLALTIIYSGEWWMDADVVHYAWSYQFDYEGITMTMIFIGLGRFEVGRGSVAHDSVYEGSAYTATWTVSAE